MSIQYHTEIFSNENLALNINFSGIKEDIVNAIDLTMSVYAYDKNIGTPIFLETLDLNQIQKLYEHLNQISIIKNPAQTTSSKFIETTDEILKILDSMESIGLDGLKICLNKFNKDEKIKNLLISLSEVELENLSAAHRQNVYQTEIGNLEILLRLEEAGSIVEEIKKYDKLKSYIARQPEKIFQNWIEKNLWVFGVEYIKKHDERKIAIFSEGDLLMEAMDGFLDLIELKRPKLDYDIFKYDSSHKCYYPSPDLSKVIGQCLFYLQSLDNYKLNLEKEYKVKVLRPRIKVVIGRTNGFNDEQFEALRMLNSNLNHIQIISYDYLLSSGRKIISAYE